jgi:hypothetical protein
MRFSSYDTLFGDLRDNEGSHHFYSLIPITSMIKQDALDSIQLIPNG